MKDLKIYQIADIIRQNWKNISIHAAPYLDAMDELGDINENFYCDSGKSVVLYFLANAHTWRGDIAKQVKAELKKRAGIK
jgi:hypothetical protein